MKRFEILLPLFAILAGTCSAAPLIYEGYDYALADGTPMAGVAATATGLSGNYAVGGSGTGGSNSAYAATGLTFGANYPPVSGGAVRLSAPTGTTSSILGVAINVPARTGSLWNSYLVSFTSKATNNNPTVQARVSDAQTTGSNNRLNAMADNFSNQSTGISYGSTATTSGGTTLATGVTYLMLSQYTHVGTAGGGTATLWVFDLAGYENWLSLGGGLEANLGTYSLANQTAASTTQTDFGTGGFHQFAISNASGSAAAQTVVYDELRWGASLDDVLPLVTGGGDPVNVTLAATEPLSQEPTAAGDAVGSFTLTRAGDTTRPLRIHLSTTGTATNGLDYPEIPPSVLIPAGSSTLVIPVPAYTDRLIEGDETVTLTITAGSGYNLPPDPTATVTLADRPDGAIATRSRFIQKLGAGIPQRIVVYGTSLTVSGAWPAQMKAVLDTTWPGRTSLVNRGGSGMASDWGTDNLSTQVIAEAPDVVFIEFSVNDAVARFDISLAEARRNLEAIINGIEAANPSCEIIIQVTNPVIGRPQGDAGWRPNLEHYQQIHRDIAAERDLLLIDPHPAWQALLDQGESEFYFYVPDGLHPNAEAQETFLTPVLLHAIGAPRAPAPNIIVDDFDANLVGEWTSSTSTPGAYQGSYRVDGNSGKGTKSATYTPEIPSAGTYPVFLRWSSLANRANNVPVTVNHSHGATQVIVNQTLNGGIWFKLGDFPLNAGKTNSIVIETTGTNGFVIADAVGVEVPSVSLRVSNGRLSEPPKLRAAVATITRTGPVTQAVQIGLTLGGTAGNGTDYDLLATSVTIPAGASEVTFNIVPKADSVFEGPESLALGIVPPGGLRAGPVTKASLVIVDPDDSPFASWQLANFNAAQLADPLISGPNADPDNDGLVNLLEAFTGMPPLEPQASPVVLSSTTVGGTTHLVLSYPRAPGTGLTGTPETSKDLVFWRSGEEYLVKGADVEPGSLQRITVRSLAPVGSQAREFLRLKVTP